MAPPKPTAPRPGSTRTGPGRLLVAIYALFALSATARAAVQIGTKFSHAPVAYVLSAFAGAVYILATVTLTVGSPTARRIAVVSCSIELAGVLAVGTWSLADPASFPDATVWSGYGSGYGFVPLVLPILGLLWLRRWTSPNPHPPSLSLQHTLLWKENTVALAGRCIRGWEPTSGAMLSWPRRRTWATTISRSRSWRACCTAAPGCTWTGSPPATRQVCCCTDTATSSSGGWTSAKRSWSNPEDLVPMIWPGRAGPGRVAIQSQYEIEHEAHYGWNKLGPEGSWRNWNPEAGRH
jgi:hypothetical protein